MSKGKQNTGTNDNLVVASSDNVDGNEHMDSVFLDGAGRGEVNAKKNSDNLRVKGNVIVSKWCPKCKQWLPVEDFTLTKNGNYGTYCSECFCVVREGRRKKSKKYVKEKRDKNGLLMFKCYKCNRYRYIVEYSKDRTRYTGRQYTCKECAKKLHKQRYKRNRNGRRSGK